MQPSSIGISKQRAPFSRPAGVVYQRTLAMQGYIDLFECRLKHRFRCCSRRDSDESDKMPRFECVFLRREMDRQNTTGYMTLRGTDSSSGLFRSQVDRGRASARGVCPKALALGLCAHTQCPSHMVDASTHSSTSFQHHDIENYLFLFRSMVHPRASERYLGMYCDKDGTSSSFRMGSPV